MIETAAMAETYPESEESSATETLSVGRFSGGATTHQHFVELTKNALRHWGSKECIWDDGIVNSCIAALEQFQTFGAVGFSIPSRWYIFPKVRNVESQRGRPISLDEYGGFVAMYHLNDARYCLARAFKDMEVQIMSSIPKAERRDSDMVDVACDIGRLLGWNYSNVKRCHNTRRGANETVPSIQWSHSHTIRWSHSQIRQIEDPQTNSSAPAALVELYVLLFQSSNQTLSYWPGPERMKYPQPLSDDPVGFWSTRSLCLWIIGRCFKFYCRKIITSDKMWEVKREQMVCLLQSLNEANFVQLCNGEQGFECQCLEDDQQVMIHSSCCSQIMHLKCFMTAMAQQEGLRKVPVAQRGLDIPVDSDVPKYIYTDSARFGEDEIYCSSCQGFFTKVFVATRENGKPSVNIFNLSVRKRACKRLKSDTRRRKVRKFSGQYGNVGSHLFEKCHDGEEQAIYWPIRDPPPTKYRTISIPED